MVKMAIFHVERPITPELGNKIYGSLGLHVISHLFLYICVEFCENISYDISIIEQTRMSKG